MAKPPRPDGVAKDGTKGEARHGEAPPALTPWPPFAPSARYTLKREWLAGKNPSWGQAADKVEGALSRAGYDDIRYYAVPGGFAIATRIERIHPDGASYGTSQRFVPRIDHLSPSNWTLESFIASLVGAPIGHYRCFLFIFSDQPFGYLSGTISADIADRWRGAGLNALSPSLRGQPYGEDMRAEVLIYQFAQVSAGHAPTLASGIDAELQLRRARLLEQLRSPP